MLGVPEPARRTLRKHRNYAKRFKLRFKGKRTKRLVKKTLRRKQGKIKLTLQGRATDTAGNVGEDKIRLRLRGKRR